MTDSTVVALELEVLSKYPPPDGLIHQLEVEILSQYPPTQSIAESIEVELLSQYPSPPAELQELEVEVLSVASKGLSLEVAFTLTDLFPEWGIGIIDYYTMDVVQSRTAVDGTNIFTGLTQGHPYLAALFPDIKGRWVPGATVSGRIAVEFEGKEYGFQAQAGTENGTTGVTEPVWPTQIGETVLDGSVVWENIGTLPEAMVHGPLIAGILN